jgi:hypothetical protein
VKEEEEREEEEGRAVTALKEGREWLVGTTVFLVYEEPLGSSGESKR